MITPPIDDFPTSIRHAAMCLWADAVWTDEATGAVADLVGSHPMQLWGRDITQWPLPAMDDDFIDAYRRILVSTEQAWGRSLHAIAAEIGKTLDDLCYSIAMQSSGHGVGPDDYQNWPDDLDIHKIPYRECPAYNFLPEPEEWAKLCTVTDEDGTCNIREYSATWGSDQGDGPLFYNFASHNLDSALAYDSLQAAIDRQIEIEKAKNTTEGDARWDGLVRLYNHVLWERINRFGRIGALTEKGSKAAS